MLISYINIYILVLCVCVCAHAWCAYSVCRHAYLHGRTDTSYRLDLFPYFSELAMTCLGLKAGNKERKYPSVKEDWMC